jgi:hypothetical protein
MKFKIEFLSRGEYRLMVEKFLTAASADFRGDSFAPRRLQESTRPGVGLFRLLMGRAFDPSRTFMRVWRFWWRGGAQAACGNLVRPRSEAMPYSWFLRGDALVPAARALTNGDW